MSIDVEAFPLIRFAGPLELRAAISREAGRGAVTAVRKALVFQAALHGLRSRDIDGCGLEFSGPGLCATPGVWWRRRLACWLMSLDEVVLLSHSHTPQRDGFRIWLEQLGS